MAKVTFNFSSLFIKHDPITIEFEIRSKNIQLIYENSVS